MLRVAGQAVPAVLVRWLLVLAALFWAAAVKAAEHGAPAATAAHEEPKHTDKPAGKLAEKAAEKPAEKTVSKPVEKAAEKPAEKPAAKADAKGLEMEPATKPIDKLAEKLAKDAASAQKARKAVHPTPEVEAANVAVEPEPGPPPLKISALQDEIRRRSTSGPEERETLSKMTADINSAREALRQDTARMEAMLSKADGGGNEPAADDGSGKKVPTPLDVVAKAMRGMKPDQAAPIISRMDHKLAADVLKRMPAADAGKVMGLMKPELAAELAAEIAQRGRGEGKR